MRARVLTLLVLFAASAQAGTLYRWKDANGVTHLETSIPPEDAQLGYQVLDDRSFRVLETVPAALSEAEREAARLAQEEAARRQMEAELQQRHDRTLLATYANLDDMQMTRDGQLRTIDSVIQSIEQTIVQQKQSLNALMETAAKHEKNGSKIPNKTLDAIADARDQLGLNEAALQENRDKRAEIERTFAEDLVRFKELKGLD